MKIKDLAFSNYKRFCQLQGNEYIASEYAIEIILNLISTFKIESILEIGLGIGSISDTVLKYGIEEKKKINYVGTENNVFCLQALKANLQYYHKLNIYSDLNQIEDKTFNLIIVDGYDNSLTEICRFCKSNSILFIEGDRKNQKDLLRQLFPKSLEVRVISLRKNKPYAHGYAKESFFIGGGTIIYINPTFFQILVWLQQKIATFIKYKIRRIL